MDIWLPVLGSIPCCTLHRLSAWGFQPPRALPASTVLPMVDIELVRVTSPTPFNNTVIVLCVPIVPSRILPSIGPVTAAMNLQNLQSSARYCSVFW